MTAYRRRFQMALFVAGPVMAFVVVVVGIALAAATGRT